MGTLIFANVPANTEIFLDANTVVYHFIGDANFGVACTSLLKRIELLEIIGWISPHVLAEVSHRLMTIEACSVFGWPYQGIAARLRKHPHQVQQLSRYEQALAQISALPLRVVVVDQQQVLDAARISRQYGLLTNDALIVSLMNRQKLSHLASNDADFDRVPGIVRNGPT
jgi:predicted nucleic acid-binding protein